jgi:transposase
MEKRRGVRKRERREFSAEFKAEAVRLMEERRAAGVAIAQVARELDVTPDQLRLWARRVGAAGAARAPEVFPGRGRRGELEAEVRRLERENATLRQERDFAKKAAAFFAKESR